jgi:acetyl-CoA C-acetyltransferase
MPEAVIVSTARTPIGRANKGSLVDMRPDDLATQMVRAALDKVPGLDPHDIDDLIMGCGQPSGWAMTAYLSPAPAPMAATS